MQKQTRKTNNDAKFLILLFYLIQDSEVNGITPTASEHFNLMQVTELLCQFYNATAMYFCESFYSGGLGLALLMYLKRPKLPSHMYRYFVSDGSILHELSVLMYLSLY